MCNIPKKPNKKTQPQLKQIVRSKTNIPLAKQGINNNGCPLCKCKLTLYDELKSETLCADCGYVYEIEYYDTIEYTQHNTTKPYTGTGYTHTEKKYFKHKNKKKINFTSSTERNKIYYRQLVDMLKFELALTKYDIQQVMTIINDAKSLKKIHSRLPVETIIIGICRYVIKQKKCLPYLLRFKNQIYKEYKLTKKDYNIIERNINKLKE